MFEKGRKAFPFGTQKDKKLPVNNELMVNQLAPDYQKQLDDQNQLIRELFEMVKLMANHKRYEHIQKKIDVIQNLLDKSTKL